MKPVALFSRFIRNSSKPGEIVLDLYGGSGTALIACEQTGRSARLMELEPGFCDVIVRRWEGFTGRKAELAEREGPREASFGSGLVSEAGSCQSASS
jgi:DNA modification methylase